MKAYGMVTEPVAVAYPKGARVRVTDEMLEGEAVVVIPIAMSYENSLVGVEFLDAPGFVWQVRRRDVELL